MQILRPQTVTSHSAAERLLKKHKIFSLDIETPKLNPFSKLPRHGTIPGLGPLMLTLWVGGKGFMWDLRKEVPQFLSPYLASREWIVIIHTSIFDCSWLAWHYGWEFRNIHDTQLTEEVLLGIGEPPQHVNTREESYKKQFSTKLNYTLARYKLAKVSKELQTSFVGMTTEPFTKEQVKYGLMDVQFLEQLREKQLRAAKRLDLLRVVDLENKVAEVAYRMKVKGIGFSKELWLDLAEKNEKILAILFAKLNKMTKNAVANWNSQQQVKAYFASKGIIINSLSDLLDDDKVSVAKAYRGKSKALDLFVKIRVEAYKYVNTYGRSWLTTEWGKHTESTIGPDGRIHADIRQIVSTGRMSYNKPNLQQLPNNIEGNANHIHRKAFVPTKGYKFVSMDFKGQELGIMAAWANHTRWIEAIHRGEDVHSIEAAKVFADWKKLAAKTCEFPFKCNCPKHAPLRERAKKVNFGMPYGKTKKGLAPELGTSIYEAGLIIHNWHKENAALSTVLKESGERAIETYEVRTLPRFNRRRSLILEPEEWRRRNQGMNTPVQGTGADMLKWALWLTWQFLEKNPVWKKRVNLLLCVHDQNMTEALEKYTQQWKRILTEISERAAAEVLGVPDLVKADIEIMDYWKPKKE